MAQPNTPDNAAPPPPKVALRATPGQFDWISMHPCFSSQARTPSASPSPAKSTTQKYISPHDPPSRALSNISPRPANPAPLSNADPPIDPRLLHPAIRQDYSYFQNHSSGQASNTNYSSTAAPYQSQLSPNTHETTYVSSNQSIFKRPSDEPSINLSLLDRSGPDLVAGSHRHPAASLPRYGYAPAQSLLGEISPNQEESVGQPQSDDEASDQLQRSPSRSSSEDTGSIDEDEDEDEDEYAPSRSLPCNFY